MAAADPTGPAWICHCPHCWPRADGSSDCMPHFNTRTRRESSDSGHMSTSEPCTGTGTAHRHRTGTAQHRTTPPTTRTAHAHHHTHTHQHGTARHHTAPHGTAPHRTAPHHAPHHAQLECTHAHSASRCVCVHPPQSVIGCVSAGPLAGLVFLTVPSREARYPCRTRAKTVGRAGKDEL